MSRQDFERCTPSEFRAICDAWQRREEQWFKTGWEQTRVLGLMVLQPYSKKRLEARDVMELPWDETPGKPEASKHREQPARAEASAKEALRARYRAAMERAGLK